MPPPSQLHLVEAQETPKGSLPKLATPLSLGPGQTLAFLDIGT